MADAQNITLVPMPDLPTLGTLNDTALIHINDNAEDFSMSVSALVNGLIKKMFPVGVVHFFNSKDNPNQLYPGTTWQRIAADRCIRTAAENAGDVGTTGGSDEITLTVAQLPAHNHAFSNGVAASAGNHTHNISGTAASSGAHTHSVSGTAASAGAHVHNLTYTGADSGASGSNSLPANGRNAPETSGTRAMSSAGAHTHSISGTAASAGAHTHSVSGTAAAAGAHTHTVTGSIGNTGGGGSINVKNKYIMLAGWYRTL